MPMAPDWRCGMASPRRSVGTKACSTSASSATRRSRTRRTWSRSGRRSTSRSSASTPTTARSASPSSGPSGVPAPIPPTAASASRLLARAASSPPAAAWTTMAPSLRYAGVRRPLAAQPRLFAPPLFPARGQRVSYAALMTPHGATAARGRSAANRRGGRAATVAADGGQTVGRRGGLPRHGVSVASPQPPGPVPGAGLAAGVGTDSNRPVPRLRG